MDRKSSPGCLEAFQNVPKAFQGVPKAFHPVWPRLAPTTPAGSGCTPISLAALGSLQLAGLAWLASADSGWHRLFFAGSGCSQLVLVVSPRLVGSGWQASGWSRLARLALAGPAGSAAMNCQHVVMDFAVDFGADGGVDFGLNELLRKIRPAVDFFCSRNLKIRCGRGFLIFSFSEIRRAVEFFFGRENLLVMKQM